MGRTLEMFAAAPVEMSRPEWARAGEAFSLLWKKSGGDLAMSATVLRIDELAASLKVSVAEVVRVQARQDPEHEGVYVRTEPLP